MGNILIDKDNDSVSQMLHNIHRIEFALKGLIKERKSTFNGDVFLTDKELSEQLKVCRRTLQDYRDDGILPYYQLGGKILYKHSDVEKVLNDYYRAGF